MPERRSPREERAQCLVETGRVVEVQHVAAPASDMRRLPGTPFGIVGDVQDVRKIRVPVRTRTGPRISAIRRRRLTHRGATRVIMPRIP